MDDTQLQGLLGEIAREVGWHLDTVNIGRTYGYTLTRGEHARISLRMDRERLVITGVRPVPTGRVEPRWNGTVGITVDPGRGARAIAADMGRRLIGPYLDAIAAWEADLAEMTAHVDARAQYRERLLAALGSHGSVYGHTPDLHWRPATGQGWADIEVPELSSTVTITLRSITQDQALEVARVLAGL